MGKNPSSVLFLSSPDSETPPRTQIGNIDDPDVNLIVVTISESPDRILDSWMEKFGSLPENLSVIGVQGVTDVTDYDVDVRTVTNADDLTGLGIEIGDRLAELDEKKPTYLYFTSITAVLQYSDLQRVYRFFNTLSGQLRTHGGVGYFDMNPEAHDERTVSTFKSLFEGVAEPDGGNGVEGSRWRVTTRS